MSQKVYVSLSFDEGHNIISVRFLFNRKLQQVTSQWSSVSDEVQSMAMVEAIIATLILETFNYATNRFRLLFYVSPVSQRSSISTITINSPTRQRTTLYTKTERSMLHHIPGPKNKHVAKTEGKDHKYD